MNTLPWRSTGSLIPFPPHPITFFFQLFHLLKRYPRLPWPPAQRREAFYWLILCWVHLLIIPMFAVPLGARQLFLASLIQGLAPIFIPSNTPFSLQNYIYHDCPISVSTHKTLPQKCAITCTIMRRLFGIFS